LLIKEKEELCSLLQRKLRLSNGFGSVATACVIVLAINQKQLKIFSFMSNSKSTGTTEAVARTRIKDLSVGSPPKIESSPQKEPSFLQKKIPLVPMAISAEASNLSI